MELRESFCHLDASRFPCLKKERENKGRKKEGKAWSRSLKKRELEKMIAQ